MNKEQFEKYFKFEKDFYSADEAAALFAACEKLPFERHKTIWKKPIRHQVVSFTERMSVRADYVGRNFKLSEAPTEIKTLQATLSSHVGKHIDYMAVVLYEDGNDFMNWHSHAEDVGYDAAVYDLSLGATRLFGVRMKDDFTAADNGKQVRREPLYFDAAPGSLITMSSEANNMCEHCVPKARSKTTYGRRISINCKSVGPRIFCCRKGQVHPPDAVYVGREVRDRRTGKVSFHGTPFANDARMSVDKFRDYSTWRMRDPGFAALVETLRGKDLLCWCSGRETAHCHAKVWLELANKPKGEPSVAPGANAETTEPEYLTSSR
jgi:alkylated DNA repair dioxygenase AlkB/uncharacterized Zn-finger protein